MSRARWSKVTRRKHKKVLALVRGHRAARSRVYKVANESLIHAEHYASVHRRLKKRQMRSLSIVRLNISLRNRGLSYSKFMHLLRQSSVEVDRKSLAALAINDPSVFDAIVSKVGADSKAN